VRRALARWPDVPDCYGWLRLDARGQWRVREREAVFGTITNPGLVEFINRNYGPGDDGRYYFQNGPQKVFVDCEYTPYVYRFSDDLGTLVTHTGTRCASIRRLLLDETGAVVVDATSGPGVLLDRDLPGLLTRLRGRGGAVLDAEDFQHLPFAVTGLGAEVAMESVRRADVAGLLKFDPHPVESARR
jgi:hypothetical protein